VLALGFSSRISIRVMDGTSEERAPLAVVVQLILCVPALGPAIVKPCVVGPQRAARRMFARLDIPYTTHL